MSKSKKFCESCGNEINESDTFCSRCGKPLHLVMGEPNNKVTNDNNMVGVIGFVTSIVNMLLCCGSLSIIPLILCGMGIAKSNRTDGEGKILSIIGLVLAILSAFIFFLTVLLPMLFAVPMIPIFGEIFEEMSY